MSNPSTPRGTTTVIVGVVAVIAVIVGSFFLFGGGSDDASPTGSDTGSKMGSPSAGDMSTSATGSSGQSNSAEASLPPVKSVDYRKPARKASKAEFAPLVPDLPAGWGITAATWDPDGRVWHVVVETPAGASATLHQAEAPESDLVASEVKGASAGKKVDLKRFQTGVWDSWTGAGQVYGLSQTFKHTSVVVFGTQRSVVTSIAQRVLTFETTRPDVQD